MARWGNRLRAIEVGFWATLVVIAAILVPTWAIVMVIVPILEAIGWTTLWATGVSVLVAIEVVIFVRHHLRRGSDI